MTTIDLSEVFGAAEKFADDDARVKDKLSAIKAYARHDSVPDPLLVRMAKLGIIISDWMQANDLDASALQCWTSIQQNYGVNACTLMSMMSESLMPSACEVDITGLLAMYVLQLASGSPSALLDWNNNYGEDPDASLAAITPGVTHPGPPEEYARPIPITALAFSLDGAQTATVTVHDLARRRVATLASGVLEAGDTNYFDLYLELKRTEMELYDVMAEHRDLIISNELWETYMNNGSRMLNAGTSNDFKDNLTVGFTRNLAVGVWTGNSDNSPMIDVSGVRSSWETLPKKAVFISSRERNKTLSTLILAKASWSASRIGMISTASEGSARGTKDGSRSPSA